MRTYNRMEDLKFQQSILINKITGDAIPFLIEENNGAEAL